VFAAGSERRLFQNVTFMGRSRAALRQHEMLSLVLAETHPDIRLRHHRPASKGTHVVLRIPMNSQVGRRPMPAGAFLETLARRHHRNVEVVLSILP